MLNQHWNQSNKAISGLEGLTSSDPKAFPVIWILEAEIPVLWGPGHGVLEECGITLTKRTCNSLDIDMKGSTLQVPPDFLPVCLFSR